MDHGVDSVEFSASGLRVSAFLANGNWGLGVDSPNSLLQCTATHSAIPRNYYRCVDLLTPNMAHHMVSTVVLLTIVYDAQEPI